MNRRPGGCFSGCWSCLVCVLALGLLITAWQASTWPLRAGELLLGLALLVGAGMVQERRKAAR